MAAMAKLRVAIIGAGSAGLSMCKSLVNEAQIQCVVFERSDNIGGEWVYRKNKKQNEYPGAMYKNLRTNLPREIMAFPEFPFPEGLPSFVSREVVLKYLEDYSDHFGLRKNIKLQHEVTSVKPSENKEKFTWQVVTKDVRNGGTELTEVFDAVVVCNGHYSDLRIPEVPGMEDFPGTVMHSYYYNEPEEFKNKTVVILGSRSSGIDLCMEISSVAKKVYLVHLGEKIPSTFSENVEEHIGTLTHGFADGSVEIGNKCRKTADCVIFCTGYNHAFPFLAPECKIEVSNNRVTSLYKHVFNTAYPSLSFVGICVILSPFPNFSLQSHWVASILTGRKVLPSREEMIKDEEMDYQERLNSGVAPRAMHSLGVERQMTYNNQLAELGGVPPLAPAFFSLFNFTVQFRSTRLPTYRDTNFFLSENEWFVIE